MVLRVMNFSPAAMNNGDSLYQIAGTLAEQVAAGVKIIAVVTAMLGVTDLLFDSIRAGNYSSVYTKLVTSHTSAARRQGRDETARKVLIQDITALMDSYRWLGKSLANRTPTPAETNTIALLGEKLCARLLAASLQNRRIQAAELNASDVLVTNGQIDPEATTARVHSRLTPLLDQGYVAVVTASANAEMAQAAAHPEGGPLAFTAALVACTSPDEIWLWIDSETYTVTKP
jgi:aspartokinase